MINVMVVTSSSKPVRVFLSETAAQECAARTAMRMWVEHAEIPREVRLDFLRGFFDEVLYAFEDWAAENGKTDWVNVDVADVEERQSEAGTLVRATRRMLRGACAALPDDALMSAIRALFDADGEDELQYGITPDDIRAAYAPPESEQPAPVAQPFDPRAN